MQPWKIINLTRRADKQIRSKGKNQTLKKSIKITASLSIIMQNVIDLNSPIKRHRLANWIKEQDPMICCLQEMQVMGKDKQRLRVKGWKKNFPSK
jgi:hypothetical protein